MFEKTTPTKNIYLKSCNRNSQAQLMATCLFYFCQQDFPWENDFGLRTFHKISEQKMQNAFKKKKTMRYLKIHISVLFVAFMFQLVEYFEIFRNDLIEIE